MITKTDVQRLADLALIDVPEAELDSLAREMDVILAYVSDIKQLTQEVTDREKPAQYNVLRDDEVTNSAGEYTEALLREAPDRKGELVRVKKIL